MGRGELLERGRGLRELRAHVPAGGFRLAPGEAAPVLRAQQGFERPALPLEFASAHASYVDGRVVPHWVFRQRLQAALVRGEIYRWGQSSDDPQIEIRLRVDLKRGFDAVQGVSLDLLGRLGQRLNLRLCERRGCALERIARGLRVRLRGRSLRPGDALHLVLLSPALSSDPGLRIRPDAALLARVGIKAARGLRLNATLRSMFSRAFAQVEAERPKFGIARGDFVRRFPGLANPPAEGGAEPGPGRPRESFDAREVLWTHGEFDATLAWLCRAARIRSKARARQALELAREIALHMVERNRSREAPRLPVQHGPAHGLGTVDAGHVFLEGLILLGFSMGDAQLQAVARELLGELREFMERGAGEQYLRSLVWPLRAFEVSQLIWQRPDDGLASERLILLLNEGFDAQAMPDWPQNRIGFGRRRAELWFVCGLLLPTLRLARQRGSARAAALHRRLVRAISRLPWARLGPAPTLIIDSKSQIHGAGSDPCAQVWLIEGFLREPSLARFAKRWSQPVLRKLPGDVWDLPTALVLCARLACLQRALSD